MQRSCSSQTGRLTQVRAEAILFLWLRAVDPAVSHGLLALPVCVSPWRLPALMPTLRWTHPVGDQPAIHAHQPRRLSTSPGD